MPHRTPARRPASAALQALLLTAGGIVASGALAGEADVVDVRLTALGGDSFRIDASVAHGDEGWDHYADRWDVYALDGTLIGTRELAHPHETEQPFTRFATVTIPAGIDTIEVRAHDSVHGDGGETFTADVPR